MVKFVNLGSSGLKVSNLCLGCMNFGDTTSETESIEILKASFEEGLRFWDTANVYSEGVSESIVGKALSQIGRRDQVVLATKVCIKMGEGPNDKGLSRRHIVQAVDDSLRRLKTDYIDLYQLHRPDPETPIEETLSTMDSLIKAGKILYYGTSTFASWQMAEAEWVARSRNGAAPISEQAPYNLLDRRIENDRAGFLKKYGWGLITWSPLAGGQLTGKYKSARLSLLPKGSRAQLHARFQERMNTDSVTVCSRFVELCQAAGLDASQAAIAWLLHQPLVTAPIIGPRSLSHLQASLPAASLKLPDDFLAKLDELVPPGTAVADFHTPNVSWQIGHLPGIEKT